MPRKRRKEETMKKRLKSAEVIKFDGSTVTVTVEIDGLLTTQEFWDLPGADRAVLEEAGLLPDCWHSARGEQVSPTVEIVTYKRV